MITCKDCKLTKEECRIFYLLNYTFFCRCKDCAFRRTWEGSKEENEICSECEEGTRFVEIGKIKLREL